MNKPACYCLGAFLFAGPVFAYGPNGHEIVGAVADDLLAKKPAGAQITALLDGITLQRASVMPDEIKGWDKKGVDDPKSFHYRDHPKIDMQLREFWRANQPTHDPNSPTPSHHWFHYTDVPLVRPEKYGDGQAGRNKWDIVHMIPYCVEVLQGRVPETNERKISKAVAVILLAHYLGDIHQPLHVGAQYFDEQGRVVDPDKDKTALEDQGGNTITLQLLDDPTHRKKLHGFWDMDTVAQLMPRLSNSLPKEQKRTGNATAITKLAHEMAAQEPKDWRMPATMDVKNYAEAWADEILPIAREAHERLLFKQVKPLPEQDRVVASGLADEKPSPDHVSYRDWSSKIVRAELQKAGWRLADLLEKSVRSTSTPPAATSTPTPAASTPTATVAPTPASPFGAYPANYKEIVTAWMAANALPVSRIDWQSEPKPAELPGANGRRLSGYLVIFNAPGRNGTAAKTRSVLIRDGVVINFSGFDR